MDNTITISDSLQETFQKMCILVPFIKSHSRQRYPADIGVTRKSKEAMYSSAQHDTLYIPYHSFWYTTESGEEKEFLDYESFCSTFYQLPIKEIPDAYVLNRLAERFTKAEAYLICQLLERMFVCVEQELTVDQYVQQRVEYWRPMVEKRTMIQRLEKEIVCYFARHIGSATEDYSGYGISYPSLDFKVTYGGLGYMIRINKCSYNPQETYFIRVEAETQRLRICSFYMDVSFSLMSISTYDSSKTDDVINILTLASAYIKGIDATPCTENADTK